MASHSWFEQYLIKGPAQLLFAVHELMLPFSNKLLKVIQDLGEQMNRVQEVDKKF